LRTLFRKEKFLHTESIFPFLTTIASLGSYQLKLSGPVAEEEKRQAEMILAGCTKEKWPDFSFGKNAGAEGSDESGTYIFNCLNS
jgi:hypothetical protein